MRALNSRLVSQDLKQKQKDYEDFWIKSIGPTLYKKFVEKYTKKIG